MNVLMDSSQLVDSSFSLFPLIEKSFNCKVSEEKAVELLALGKEKAEELLSLDVEWKYIKEKNGVDLYEYVDPEIFTVKSVTTMHASICEVLSLLAAKTSRKLRDIMEKTFSSLFLDGVVLHSDNQSEYTDESFCIKWMVLQSARTHLAHRDYVFLQYSDMIEKQTANPSMYSNSSEVTDPRSSFVGVQVMESIELEGCPPMPQGQNVVRSRLRRCGYIVEETHDADVVRVSFFFSKLNGDSTIIASSDRTWMHKIAVSLGNLNNCVVSKRLSNQSILGPKDWSNQGTCCRVCMKSFGVFRRRHHCRICGEPACSKCTMFKEITSRLRGGIKSIRVCTTCAKTPAISKTGQLSASSRSQGSVRSVGDDEVSMSGVESDVDSMYDLSDGINPHKDIAECMDSIYEDLRENDEEVLALKKKISMESLYEGLVESTLNPADELYADENILTLLPQKSKPSSLGQNSSQIAGSNTTESNSTGEASEDKSQTTLVKENTPFVYPLTYANKQAWPKAPRPDNEQQRLAKIVALGIQEKDTTFQEMCELAAVSLSCPIAGICFVGDDAGYFIARRGIDKAHIARDVLFESHTIMSSEPTIVLDTTTDVRFINNPLVNDYDKIRFYVGFPLITEDGIVVGAVSVADVKPWKSLSSEKIFFLKNLSSLVIQGVEKRARDRESLALHTNYAAAPHYQTGVTYQYNQQQAARLRGAEETMKNLLKTAYYTQCQVKMQVAMEE